MFHRTMAKSLSGAKVRRVKASAAIPRKGRPVIWAFGYADLAVALGRSESAVRTLVYRKRFDPTDLVSVANYIRDHGPAARAKP